VNTATEAQVRFINRLKGERRWEDVPAQVELVEAARVEWAQGEFTKQRASRLIDNLQYAPVRAEVAPTRRTPRWRGCTAWTA
jgi:hypothetical protein